MMEDVGKNEKVHKDGCDPQENDLHHRITGYLTSLVDEAERRQS